MRTLLITTCAALVLSAPCQAGLVLFNDVNLKQLTELSPTIVEGQLQQALSGQAPYYLFKISKVLKNTDSLKVEKEQTILVRTAGFLMGKLAARAFSRSGQLRTYTLNRFQDEATALIEKNRYILFLDRPAGSIDYEFSARGGVVETQKRRAVSSIIKKSKRKK